MTDEILTKSTYYIVRKIRLRPGETVEQHKHSGSHESIVIVAGAAHISTAKHEDTKPVFSGIPLSGTFTINKDMWHTISNVHVFDDLVYIETRVGVLEPTP